MSWQHQLKWTNKMWLDETQRTRMDIDSIIPLVKRLAIRITSFTLFGWPFARLSLNLNKNTSIGSQTDISSHHWPSLAIWHNKWLAPKKVHPCHSFFFFVHTARCIRAQYQELWVTVKKMRRHNEIVRNEELFITHTCEWELFCTDWNAVSLPLLRIRMGDWLIGRRFLETSFFLWHCVCAYAVGFYQPFNWINTGNEASPRC